MATQALSVDVGLKFDKVNKGLKQMERAFATSATNINATLDIISKGMEVFKKAFEVAKKAFEIAGKESEEFRKKSERLSSKFNEMVTSMVADNDILIIAIDELGNAFEAVTDFVSSPGAQEAMRSLFTGFLASLQMALIGIKKFDEAVFGVMGAVQSVAKSLGFGKGTTAMDQGLFAAGQRGLQSMIDKLQNVQDRVAGARFKGASRTRKVISASTAKPSAAAGEALGGFIGPESTPEIDALNESNRRLEEALARRNEIVKKQNEEFQIEQVKAQTESADAANAWISSLQDVAVQVTAGFGAMFANMIISITQGTDSIASGLKKLIGGIIVQMGTLLIQLGTVGVLAGTLGTFILPLRALTGGELGVAAGLAAIAGGTAMVAAGAALGGSGAGTNAAAATQTPSAAGANTSFSGSRNQTRPGTGEGGATVININYGRAAIVGSKEEVGAHLRELLGAHDRLRPVRGGA